MVAKWNHPPFFDYVDRWMTEADGPKRGFTRQMWDLYRRQADEIGAKTQARRRAR